MKIKSIKKIKLDKKEKVYDLSVDKYHNFIINESQVVVHNCFYHHGDCLDFFTEIHLSNGKTITIGDWFKNHNNESFEVLCLDEDFNLTTSIGHTPIIGHITSTEYNIELEDGEIIKCTNNHPFLISGEWVEAENIVVGDILVSINGEIKVKNIKIITLEKKENYYDITVENYHNFVIGKNKIVVHNSSLNGAIISMTQKFKNNLPLLEEKGQFGSLRSPEASAPRYIGTHLSKNFYLIYKDFELLTPKYEEGYEIEPEFFLPIIPTILVNGQNGIAIGYASNILNRNPKEVITACTNYLQDKKINKLKPFLNEFNGTYKLDKDNSSRWIINGKYEVINTTTIRITELPPSMTYEKYENVLDKLIDERKIKSYEDNSNAENSIDYLVKMSREDLENLDDLGVINLFKLSESSTENFTTLDENKKLKIFDSAEDIVKYFVDFRLTYYFKRKELQIEKLNLHIKNIDNRIRFIQAILEEKIIINKKSKEDIIKQIIKVGLDKRDDSYEYLLSMPIHSLSKERWEEMKLALKDKKDELKIVKGTVPKEVYIQELEELKNKI